MVSNKGQYRLFIDPGSNSTGWALFLDKKCVKHGTIATILTKEHALKRINDIGYGYYRLASELCHLSFVEIYFERMNHRVKECIWSVGAIGATLLDWGAFKWGGEISPLSWQKYVDWKGKRRKLERYKRKVRSEDELAAIGIGIYYNNGRNGISSRNGNSQPPLRKRKKVRSRKAKN